MHEYKVPTQCDHSFRFGFCKIDTIQILAHNFMQYLDRLMNQIMTKIQNDDLYKTIVNLGIFILASGKI